MDSSTVSTCRLKPFSQSRSVATRQYRKPNPQIHEPMKSFHVSAGSTFSVALFSDVTNSRELLELMQSGKMEPEVALLNASLVPDIFPVLAAAHKALVSKSRESLTTRTLHSELVYNYAASKHISESLKRCGISDQMSYILAVRFNASDDEMTSVTNLINGKEIDLEELEPRSNRDQILKHFKIPPQELAISSLSDAITCRIAARDAL
ncbi:EKC/KEOPS complex subunit CGI121 [Rhynchospora pubera]|uniref:EKC/KEOPS complex subunit CGI121 n=1 Tax=Rhynchospora pubera TaxID=906938 RepID=A0AAV8GW27_9POAL|nr:EKC/KEOPS complex subunit CGI121 [Rhynchospora pubera]